MAFEDIRKGLENYMQEMGKKTVHGQWINGYVDFICSECQAHNRRRTNTCPNCGAKMEA